VDPPGYFAERRQRYRRRSVESRQSMVTTCRRLARLVIFYSFCRAMRCISAAYAVIRCLSVCLSRLWVVSKRIKISSKFFLPSGSHIIVVFPYQTGWRYSDGNPLTWASNAGGAGRNRDSVPFCLLLTLQQARCCKHGRRWTTATISQVVTIISLVVHCGYSTTKHHAR